MYVLIIIANVSKYNVDIWLCPTYEKELKVQLTLPSLTRVLRIVPELSITKLWHYCGISTG